MYVYTSLSLSLFQRLTNDYRQRRLRVTLKPSGGIFPAAEFAEILEPITGGLPEALPPGVRLQGIH